MKGKQKPQASTCIRTHFLLMAPIFAGCSVPVASHTDFAAANAVTVTERDGQHDFDPLNGSWKVHSKVRQHPLTGSDTWIEFDGTSIYHKIWGGRAELDEAVFNAPGSQIERSVPRLYNPQSHEWSLYWANSSDGIFDPPQVGQFKNGRGDFYALNTINGNNILIRFDWSRMNTNSPHFEQAISADGGTTWKVNWITDQTKIGDESDKEN